MTKHIFIDRDLKTLKKQIQTTHKPVYNRLITQCETYFAVELPKEHPPTSSTYMGIAMANLALAYLLTEEERYLTEAKRWLFTCVNYPHWGNAHLVDVDLSAAWILFGMGIVYDWLQDDFTPEERTQIREKIVLQGTRMYDFKRETEGAGWSTNYWQNHNWINLTGLSAAGYALIDEDSEIAKLAKDWISCAKENFETVYSLMANDGSDYEGVVYWRYGAMWLFVYAHLVKERESIDHFASCDFLRNTFYYRLYQAAPNLQEQIPFGDAHDRLSGHSTAIYYKVASEYKNGHAQKLGNLVRDEFLATEATSRVKPGILPECFFEVLFYDPTVKEEDFATLPLTKYFDDLGLFTTRSSWKKDATLLSFKCSYPGGKKQWDLGNKFKEEKGYKSIGLSHQHPDNNSFILTSQGEFFAIDDGYNRHVKAADHNTILVDGEGYVDEGVNNIWKNYTKDMVGEMEKVVVEPAFAYLVGETAKTYKKELKLTSFKRHLLHTGSSWYLMIDELASNLPHHYSWQMYSDVYPKVATPLQSSGEAQASADIAGSSSSADSSTDTKFTYTINNAQVDLYHLAKPGVATKHEHVDNTIRAIMTTQEPDKFTENPMKGLRITNTEKAHNVSYMALFHTAPKAEKLQVTKLSGNEAVAELTAMGKTAGSLSVAGGDGTNGATNGDGTDGNTNLWGIAIQQKASNTKEVIMFAQDRKNKVFYARYEGETNVEVREL